MSWQEFFSMGGYARYVWPSFGLVALVLAWQGLGSWLQLKRARRLVVEIRDEMEQA